MNTVRTTLGRTARSGAELLGLLGATVTATWLLLAVGAGQALAAPAPVVEPAPATASTTAASGDGFWTWQLTSGVILCAVAVGLVTVIAARHSTAWRSRNTGRPAPA